MDQRYRSHHSYHFVYPQINEDFRRHHPYLTHGAYVFLACLNLLAQRLFLFL